MQIILITGLDGSGKSTVLRKLKTNTEQANEFIFVPHIETSNLVKGTDTYRLAKFINNLSSEADKNKIPQLKGIALFASMLIFKDLLENKRKKKPNIIFIERHPLIDTGIYAQFYASKLKPNSLNLEIVKDLDTRFSYELKYILNLIPKDLIKLKESPTNSFLHFIYNWFYEKEKNHFKDLLQIFDIDLPSKIYFLKADAEILFSRIKNRDVREAHESLSVLKKLNLAYISFFTEIENEYTDMVETIDANNVEVLNEFAEKLILKHK